MLGSSKKKKKDQELKESFSGVSRTKESCRNLCCASVLVEWRPCGPGRAVTAGTRAFRAETDRQTAALSGIPPEHHAHSFEA